MKTWVEFTEHRILFRGNEWYDAGDDDYEIEDFWEIWLKKISRFNDSICFSTHVSLSLFTIP